MAEVITRGRLKLQPIDGSIDPLALDVEIDLVRDDGALTVGDLRAAAESFGAHGHHEVAHRLWNAASRALSDLDEQKLATKMTQQADVSLEHVSEEVSESFRRSGVKFDYRKIANERQGGMSVSDVALTNGCSPSTVGRAVEFSDTWDQLLVDQPDFAAKLMPAANPDELAGLYGVDVKIMRWIVAVSFDRRR